MIPEHAATFAGIAGTLAAPVPVSVVLGAEDGGAYDIQRLTISERLADDFRLLALAALPEDPNDIELRPYDPGFKPEPNQVVYVDLRAVESIRDIVTAVRQVGRAAQFGGDAETIRQLRFYAISTGAGARRATFFRVYSQKKELSTSGMLAAVFRRGAYDRLRSPAFLFDDDIDCVAAGNYLFIRRVSNFQRIFRYFEEVRARAGETADVVMLRIPISNGDAFRAACVRDLQMAAKVNQIARKPYLPRVTMADLRRTIDEFRLGVTIVAEDGQDKLVFNNQGSQRWEILRLLDDEYLGSTMTHQLYEVNSKSLRA